MNTRTLIGNILRFRAISFPRRLADVCRVLWRELWTRLRLLWAPRPTATPRRRSIGSQWLDTQRHTPSRKDPSPSRKDPSPSRKDRP